MHCRASAGGGTIARIDRENQREPDTIKKSTPETQLTGEVNGLAKFAENMR